MNTKLNHYIKADVCKSCGNKLKSKNMIMMQGGNQDLCTHCNVQRGLIK